MTLFGLALLFVVIPTWVVEEAGPGFGLSASTMPNVAAITATALAALFFVYRVRTRDTATTSDEKDNDPPPIDSKGWLFLLRGALFLVAMAFLFEWVGFLAAGPLTIAGFMFMMGERRLLPIGLTAIIATVLIWLFFWQFLKFPLP